MKLLRVTILAVAGWLLLPNAWTEDPPLLLKEAISREVSVFVGSESAVGEPDAQYRQVISREMSVFIGAEIEHPYQQVISRETSVVVSTPEVPAPLAAGKLQASTSTNAYSAIDLDWTRYNALVERDILRYRVYTNATEFSSVTGMTPHGYLPGDTWMGTVRGLQCHSSYYVAVAPEDVLGQWNPQVRSVPVQASQCKLDEVSNLAVVCGQTSLDFSWTPPEGSSNFLAGYYLSLGDGAPVWLDRNAKQYSAKGLLPATCYSFPRVSG